MKQPLSPKSRKGGVAFGLPLAMVLGLLLPVAALGQARFGGSDQDQEGVSQEPIETFEDRTSVFEVQVPINVVDRNGHPVRGLTRADFEIAENGKVQDIESFRVVDLDTIEPDPLKPQSVDEAIPSAARRYFLFLFDLSFSAPTAVVRARQAARDFVLQKMHPTDLAAVATHSIEGGPKLVMTFSPDRAQLARAIDTLGAPRLTRLKNRDPLRFLVDLPDIATTPAAIDTGNSRGLRNDVQATLQSYLTVVGKQVQKMEKSYARGRVSAWTGSMSQMAGVLGGIEGRKHIVYFSEGFDGRLLLGRQPDFDDEEMWQDQRNIEDGRYFMVDSDDRYGNTQLHGDMAMMLRGFKEANCVIQAVDISGLTADLPSERRVNRVGRDALFYIANDTGGTLFEEANDFGEQLSEVLGRSSVTYLASYKPKATGTPGEYRRIKVRLKKGNGRLSHRPGYEVPLPYADIHPMEKSLLAADLIATATPRNDMEMSVLAAPFSRQRERGVRSGDRRDCGSESVGAA